MTKNTEEDDRLKTIRKAKRIKTGIKIKETKGQRVEKIKLKERWKDEEKRQREKEIKKRRHGTKKSLKEE